MRVVHLLRKYDPAGWGGTEIAVQRLVDGLRDQGVTPVIYCPRLQTQRAGARPGDGSRQVAGAGPRTQIRAQVKRFRACLPVWGMPREERRRCLAVGGNLMSFDLLPALWRERDLALVHTHTLGRLGGIAATVARGRRLPLVVSIHGGLLDLPPVLKRSFQQGHQQGWEWGKVFGLLLRSRRLLHYADAVLACNSGEATLLRAWYPTTRVEIQPHGVDTAAYRKEHRAAARAAFPQICGREVLLCAGRIDPVKNQAWLIAQAPEVLRDHPSALIVLAGACTDEAYGRELDRQIRQLGLSQRVLLTGGLPPGDARLIGLFQESRALLLPSISETFGLVLLEAWASGTVVVASRTSGASALVRDGENGWLFDLNAPHTFRRAVSQSLRDPGLRAQLAESGRRLVSTCYDVASTVRRVKHLYQELIEAKHALRHST